ncbi:hypothetical protein B0T13DRAFT_189975 [Neurospora crassa]|nr:hypothetical protein B0T13DRAFT_189975 [Neurospora crassa]
MAGTSAKAKTGRGGKGKAKEPTSDPEAPKFPADVIKDVLTAQRGGKWHFKGTAAFSGGEIREDSRTFTKSQLETSAYYNFVSEADTQRIADILTTVTTPMYPTNLSQAKYYKHVTTIRKAVELNADTINEKLDALDKKPDIYCLMATVVAHQLTNKAASFKTWRKSIDEAGLICTLEVATDRIYPAKLGSAWAEWDEGTHDKQKKAADIVNRKVINTALDILAAGGQKGLKSSQITNKAFTETYKYLKKTPDFQDIEEQYVSFVTRLQTNRDEHYKTNPRTEMPLNVDDLESDTAAATPTGTKRKLKDREPNSDVEEISATSTTSASENPSTRETDSDLEELIAMQATYLPASKNPVVTSKSTPHSGEPVQQQTLNLFGKRPASLQTPKVKSSSDIEASPMSSSPILFNFPSVGTPTKSMSAAIPRLNFGLQQSASALESGSVNPATPEANREVEQLKTSLQDCHRKITQLEEKCENLQQKCTDSQQQYADLQHDYADLAAQQNRMRWALVVISAQPIDFLDKQQQLAMTTAVATYTGDEVSIVDLTTRWAALTLGLDGAGTIKVFEGKTEVSKVTSVDLRADKLFAVVGPGVGVFTGWELFCGAWSTMGKDARDCFIAQFPSLSDVE